MGRVDKKLIHPINTFPPSNNIENLTVIYLY